MKKKKRENEANIKRKTELKVVRKRDYRDVEGKARSGLLETLSRKK